MELYKQYKEYKEIKEEAVNSTILLPIFFNISNNARIIKANYLELVMDEQKLLMLLSHLTKQLVISFEEEGHLKNPEEFANRLTEAVWDGLISMMRDSLASKQNVVIDDLGAFNKIEDTWQFNPAATLVEGYSLSLNESEGAESIVNQAVFYLEQAINLLKYISYDMEFEAPRIPTLAGQISGLLTLEGMKEHSPQKLSNIILNQASDLIKISRSLNGDPNYMGIRATVVHNPVYQVGINPYGAGKLRVAKEGSEQKSQAQRDVDPLPFEE